MRKGQGSIFKSPDAVDGKVGVMASGRPLTQVFWNHARW